MKLHPQPSEQGAALFHAPQCSFVDVLLPFPLLQVSNGNLLAILNRHYQDLTCLCFTDDSSHFLSGAKDCLALVWNLYR